ncbi:MAG: hypothetical protein Q4A32_11115 [Lachnospiraceae bacterium]|nr:hypothetical protein [Lachnospiraceae bacterium]
MKTIGSLCFVIGFMCICMGISILMNSFNYSVPAEGTFVRAVKRKGMREKYEKFRNLMFMHDVYGLQVKGVSLDEVPIEDTEKYLMGEKYTIWTHRLHPEMFRVDRKGNAKTGGLYLAAGLACLVLMVLLRRFY